MKVTNLTSSPVLLGDGFVIGAFGTPDATRTYKADKWTPRDERRIQRGELAIEQPAPAPPKKETAPAKSDDGDNAKGKNK